MATDWADDLLANFDTTVARDREEEIIRQQNIAEKGNISRGWSSSIDNLQATGMGAIGLAGDAMGVDSVRDWGFEGYQDNMREASLNPTDVPNFTDINTDQGPLEAVSDTGKWFAGTIGSLAPSVASSLVTSFAGAAAGSAVEPGIGTAAGAVGGLFGKKLVIKQIDDAVAELVAKNVAKDVAEAQVKAQVLKRATAARIGSSIGIIENTAATEGGGMWGEDAAQHGVENANAGSAFLLGQVSGVSEIYSPGGALVQRLTGVKGAVSSVVDKVADTFLKRLGTEVPESMGGEAAQEIFQSFLGTLNKKIQDPTVSLTDRTAIYEYINAGAAGAAGGLVFGGVNAAFPERPAQEPPVVDPLATPDLTQNHTVDDVLNDNSAKVAIDSAKARQAISITDPNMTANTVAGVFNQPESPSAVDIISTDNPYQRIDVPLETGVEGGLPRGILQENVGTGPGAPGQLGEAAGSVEQSAAIEQPNMEDVKRLGPHLREMLNSLVAKKEDNARRTPSFVMKATLNQWYKDTGEDLTHVGSGPARETLEAIRTLQPLNETQAKVWSYLKSVAENKAMQAEQESQQGSQGIPASTSINPPADRSTGELPADFGGTSVEPNISTVEPNIEPNIVPPVQSKPPLTPSSLSAEIARLKAKKEEASQPAADDERFTDMVKVLNNQTSAADLETSYQDMAGIFKARPELAQYQERFAAARDAAAAKLTGAVNEPTVQQTRQEYGSNNAGETGANVSESVGNGEQDIQQTSSANAAEQGADNNLQAAGEIRANHEVINNTDSAAHGHEVNTAPSEAQAEAGNYKKAHVNIDGLDITVENPAGSTRSGTDKQGRSWTNTMAHDYGYIKGTTGYDKDHVDVFLAPGYQGGGQTAYVVNQHHGNGSFDEHKAVLGATSEADAMAVYNANYEKGWTGGKSIVAMPITEFTAWAKSDNPKNGLLKGNNTPDSVPAGVTSPGPEIIEHTTKPNKQGKTKIIKGIVRTDLTREQAKEIDPYTFKKDGGLFIREKYLPKAEPLSTTSDKIDDKPAADEQKAESKDVPQVPSTGAKFNEGTSIQGLTIRDLGGIGSSVQFAKGFNKDIYTITDIDNDGRVQVGKDQPFRFSSDFKKAETAAAPSPLKQEVDKAKEKKENPTPEDDVTFVIKSLQTSKEEELTLKGKPNETNDRNVTGREDNSNEPGSEGSPSTRSNQPAQNKEDAGTAGEGPGISGNAEIATNNDEDTIESLQAELAATDAEIEELYKLRECLKA